VLKKINDKKKIKTLIVFMIYNDNVIIPIKEIRTKGSNKKFN